MRWNMIPGNWNLIQQEDSLVTNKNMVWSQKWWGLKQTNRERFTRKHEKHWGLHHISPLECFESAEVQPESVLEISISKIMVNFDQQQCELGNQKKWRHEDRDHWHFTSNRDPDCLIAGRQILGLPGKPLSPLVPQRNRSKYTCFFVKILFIKFIKIF